MPFSTVIKTAEQIFSEVKSLKTYINGRIISGGRITEGNAICVENGKIVSAAPEKEPKGETIDLEGNYIAPGFIDIHCHGGGGAEFIDGTYESIKTACDLHYKHGTRVIYPTISAADYDTTVRALIAVREIKNECSCIIPGVHLEGPYLAPSMAGGQAGKQLRKPDYSEYSELYSEFGSLIARWTYAPEQDDNLEFTSFLKKNGIVASAGHSAAKYDELMPAFDNGCRLITHLFSCTSTITRQGGFRYPGVIETAFLLDDMYAEVIGDGKHLPPELLRMTFKIKGPDRICLITDSLRPGGAGKDMEGKIYDECAVPFIIEDGVAKLPDRSAFAGSIATADVLLKTSVSSGISLPDTVKMLTETPAGVMGLTSMGRIEPGYDGIFTVFNENLEIIDF